MNERLNTVGAVALGLVLASLPFVMFGVGGGHSHSVGPHMDHAPRHGGQLGMVDDHHLELVRRNGRLLVYASDAQRKPVNAIRGTLAFDDAEPVPMERMSFCLAGPDRPAEDVTCAVWLEDGAYLELSFGLDPAITAS